MSLSEGLLKEALNAGLGIDLLHPLNSMTSDVYFRPPLTEHLHVTIFRPFMPQVWISILVCMLFCTVLVYKLRLFDGKNGSSHNSNTSSHSHVFLQFIQFLRGRYFKNGKRSEKCTEKKINIFRSCFYVCQNYWSQMTLSRALPMFVGIKFWLC